tara:strand:+ start:188 stop:784 length:597 start_codon:yes stop_codon:yes gene_type:complete
MSSSLEINKYRDIYQDFLNPNPHIHSKAISILRKDFEVKFLDNLLTNLEEEDLFIRRKSILALGEFGEEVLNHIVRLYSNTNEKSVKVCCIKTILRVVVNFNLKELNKDVMTLIELALEDTSPEITLSLISLLRQLGIKGRDILLETCKDKDLLRAKASVSALLEMKDNVVDDLFAELLNDKLIDPMIKDDILRHEKI